MRVWTLLFLMLAWPLAAQDTVEIVRPAPEGRILDDARLFTLEPHSLEKLSNRLTEISERTGYQVYVAIFDSLISSDVSEQARLLQDGWIGETPGVVLVLESDSALYELGWSRTPDAVTDTGQKLPLLGAADLAPQEQVRILNRLNRLEPDEAGSTRLAEVLISTFADEIDEAFKRVEAAEPERWNVRVLMLGTGLLAGMLLIGFLIGGWIRQSDRKVTERMVFPEVTVGMRLGAQRGGGKISSRSFDVLPHGDS